MLTSTYFLALSQAPPVLDMETAICTPDTSAPARMPDRVRVPNRMPTTRGVSITSAPGAIISPSEACAHGSTQTSSTRTLHECHITCCPGR